MIEVDLHLTLTDGARRFVLAPAFASDARVIGIYGASGAGKSLTLQAMAGLVRPEGGHVRIAGTTLYDAKQGVDVPTRARSVGYLFQHYALFQHLSVRDNIAFGLRSWWRRRLDPEGRRRVDELLDLFEIGSLADSRPAALSGGQQQRVALARALACEPRVLLLDEPFAALNPMLRSGLRSELGALRRRLDIPVVMITHDIDDLAALAEHVIVLDDGRVVREIDLRMHERLEDGLSPLRPEPLLPAQRERARALHQALEHI